MITSLLRDFQAWSFPTEILLSLLFEWGGNWHPWYGAAWVAAALPAPLRFTARKRGFSARHSDFAILLLIGFGSSQMKSKLSCHSAPISALQTRRAWCVLIFFCLFLVKTMNFALCGTSWWIKTSPQAYALPPGLLVLSPVVMLYLLQESTPATTHFLGWRRSNFCQKNYKNSILLNPCSDFHHEWPLGMKIPVNFIGSKKLYILFENQKRGKKKCYGTIKSFLRNPLFMFALGVSAALIWILSYWMPCMTFYRRWSNCFWKSYSYSLLKYCHLGDSSNSVIVFALKWSY